MRWEVIAAATGISLSFLLIVKQVLNTRNISEKKKNKRTTPQLHLKRKEILEKIYGILIKNLKEGEATGKYTERIINNSKGQYIGGFIGDTEIVKPSMLYFEDELVYSVKGIILKNTLYLEEVNSIDILEKSKKILSSEVRERNRDYYSLLGIPSTIISLLSLFPLYLLISGGSFMISPSILFLLIVAALSLLMEFVFYRIKANVYHASGIYKKYSDNFGEVGDIPVVCEHPNLLQDRAFVSIEGFHIHNYGAIQVKTINGSEVDHPETGKKRMILLLLIGLAYGGLLFKGYTHTEYTHYKSYLKTLDKKRDFDNYQDIVDRNFVRGERVTFNNQLVLKTTEDSYNYYLLDKKIILSSEQNTAIDELYSSNNKLQKFLLDPSENPEVGRKVHKLKSYKKLGAVLSKVDPKKQNTIYKAEDAIEELTKEYLANDNILLQNLRRTLEKEVPNKLILKTSSPYLPGLPLLEVRVNDSKKSIVNIPSDKTKYYRIPSKDSIIKRLVGSEVSSISGYIKEVQRIDGVTLLSLTEFPVFSSRKIEEYSNADKLLVLYAVFILYFILLIGTKLILYRIRVNQYREGNKNEYTL